MTTEEIEKCFQCGDELLRGQLSRGMTLRDYFAAAALQGLVGATQSMTHVTVSMVAEEAYQYADAMLEARDNRS